MVLPSWNIWLNAILSFTTLASAYRPVQHCKQLGDNGHYSACTSLTQHYNTTSGQSDLFIRYHWYKYKESKNGWHSFALGKQMAGAMMFIMYGDPTTPSQDMTVSVRSATGHSPPLLIHDIAKFNTPKAEGRIPEVEIVTSKFETYNGAFVHPTLFLKPTHVGIAEIIVRGYARWVGTTVSNVSTAQPMLWSSRHDQDFQEDYSIDRSIEMHPFGMGFGFIFADLLNAETPTPMFAPIYELSGLKGLVEIGEPEPPTPEELKEGEAIVSNAHLGVGESDLGVATPDGEHNPFNDHSNTTPSTSPPDASDNNKETGDSTSPPPSSSTGTTTIDDQTKPTWTLKGKTIRDWMWHLHGFLMCLAFFVLYPLAIYLLRSPSQITAGTSFNHHWTINALATVTFSIGCFVGYLQSRGISVTHQFVGIALVIFVATQMLLGWRHHISFIVNKRKTIMSRIHVGLGRVIMPLGFVNILSGMKLRQYGWFTMLLVLVLIIIEVVFGAVYLRASHVRRIKMGGAAVAEEMKAQGPGRDDDEEEFFQLAGDDESGSDDGEDRDAEAGASRRREEKRVENERLAKLDRV